MIRDHIDAGRRLKVSRVSIIIPVYNVEQYLTECIDSVLGQTLNDLEVICIDDCSPDKCGQILDAYAADDDRIKVIHLEANHRQGYGRNLGLEYASGEYVYFLDADDTIVPEALAELSELADSEELDVIFFDSRDVYDSEELRNVYRPPFELRRGSYRDDVYRGEDLLDDFIRQDEWTCYPQRTFWRRQFLADEGIRYPEGCEHEDEFFAYAGILAAKRAMYVPKQYFNLRVRANSVMTSRSAPKNFHGYLMNYYYMNRYAAERGISSYGAEANISRMFERIMTLYLALSGEFDLEKEFTDSRDRTIYRCFLSYIQAEYGDYAIDPEVLDEIRKHRIVYIYGVGPTAYRFCERLEHKEGILIGGFLFDMREDTPKVLRGRHVYAVQETDIPEDAVVVAAVKKVFWEEISKMMEKKKVRCIFHRKI